MCWRAHGSFGGGSHWDGTDNGCRCLLLWPRGPGASVTGITEQVKLLGIYKKIGGAQWSDRFRFRQNGQGVAVQYLDTAAADADQPVAFPGRQGLGHGFAGGADEFRQLCL